MTYAPPTIKTLASYWVARGGVNLGIVGDAAHTRKGVSYHLGRSDLALDAYSRQTARDRAGLTDAASALDIGKLNGNLGQLRSFSRWFVERCRSNAPGTQDVREFIYSPDGIRILRWDRERGVNSAPRTGEANNSHLAHSHISFYRDSEKRSKVGLFSPYFTPAKAPATDVTPAIPAPPKEAPVAEDRTLTAIVKLADQLIPNSTGDKQITYARRLLEYSGRVFTALVPTGDLDADDDNTEGLFSASINDETVLVIGGSPDNPNGVTFTAGAAVVWWQAVFTGGLNISKVRSTLTPGSKVLTEAGLAKARELGVSSTNFAPEDYNPLGLEVIA